MLKLYTDGSCRPNPGKGGWAFILLDEEFELSCAGFEEKSTNNRMEITAAIEGLRAIRELGMNVTVFTDSSYVIKAITGKCKRSQNLDLLKLLDDEVEILEKKGISIFWEWVKGHNNNEYNEKVDKLARRAALGRDTI